MEKEHKQHNEWLSIEELVIKAKNGDKNACGELINKFENYFNKFFLIIKHGKIDIRDRETRFLLSLFVPKDQYVKSRNIYQDKDTLGRVLASLRSITAKFANIPDEDIKQELYLIFIKLIHRYEPNGKLFGSYLCTAFVYEVSRYIKKIIKNPISSENNINYNDLYAQGSNIDEFKILNNLQYDELININDEIDYDDSWVLGITCSDIFLCLTPLERIILVKYYIEGLNDREISEMYGINRNIANQKRRAAIEKLKKKITECGGKDI